MRMTDTLHRSISNERATGRFLPRPMLHGTIPRQPQRAVGAGVHSGGRYATYSFLQEIPKTKNGNWCIGLHSQPSQTLMHRVPPQHKKIGINHPKNATRRTHTPTQERHTRTNTKMMPAKPVLSSPPAVPLKENTSIVVPLAFVLRGKSRRRPHYCEICSQPRLDRGCACV